MSKSICKIIIILSVVFVSLPLSAKEWSFSYDEERVEWSDTWSKAHLYSGKYNDIDGCLISNQAEFEDKLFRSMMGMDDIDLTSTYSISGVVSTSWRPVDIRRQTRVECVVGAERYKKIEGAPATGNYEVVTRGGEKYERVVYKYFDLKGSGNEDYRNHCAEGVHRYLFKKIPYKEDAECMLKDEIGADGKKYMWFPTKTYEVCSISDGMMMSYDGGYGVDYYSPSGSTECNKDQENSEGQGWKISFHKKITLTKNIELSSPIVESQNGSNYVGVNKILITSKDGVKTIKPSNPDNFVDRAGIELAVSSHHILFNKLRFDGFPGEAISRKPVGLISNLVKKKGIALSPIMITDSMIVDSGKKYGSALSINDRWKISRSEFIHSNVSINSNFESKLVQDDSEVVILNDEEYTGEYISFDEYSVGGEDLDHYGSTVFDNEFKGSWLGIGSKALGSSAFSNSFDTFDYGMMEDNTNLVVHANISLYYHSAEKFRNVDIQNEEVSYSPSHKCVGSDECLFLKFKRGFYDTDTVGFQDEDGTLFKVNSPDYDSYTEEQKIALIETQNMFKDLNSTPITDVEIYKDGKPIAFICGQSPERREEALGIKCEGAFYCADKYCNGNEIDKDYVGIEVELDSELASLINDKKENDLTFVFYGAPRINREDIHNSQGFVVDVEKDVGAVIGKPVSMRPVDLEDIEITDVKWQQSFEAEERDAILSYMKLLSETDSYTKPYCEDYICGGEDEGDCFDKCLIDYGCSTLKYDYGVSLEEIVLCADYEDKSSDKTWWDGKLKENYDSCRAEWCDPVDIYCNGKNVFEGAVVIEPHYNVTACMLIKTCVDWDKEKSGEIRPIFHNTVSDKIDSVLVYNAQERCAQVSPAEIEKYTGSKASEGSVVGSDAGDAEGCPIEKYYNSLTGECGEYPFETECIDVEDCAGANYTCQEYKCIPNECPIGSYFTKDECVKHEEYECEVNEDCDSNEECSSENECVELECLENEVITDHECVLKTPDEDGCMYNYECDYGQICEGGLCVDEESVYCELNSDCAADNQICGEDNKCKVLVCSEGQFPVKHECVDSKGNIVVKAEASAPGGCSLTSTNKPSLASFIMLLGFVGIIITRRRVSVKE